MHKNLLKLTALFIFFIVDNSFSQKIEFGLGAGISTFKGDISPKYNPLQYGLGATGLFRYNLSKSVSLRGNVLFTNYNAFDKNTNDPFYNTRAVSATGNIFEGTAICEYNFFNKKNIVKKAEWTPYLFGGIGYSKVNNKSFINQPPKKINTPIIPYGVGIKYKLKGPFSISSEFGSRFTLDDNFDLNYDKFYGPKNVPTNDKRNYGDITRKDQYFFTSVTLTYTIFNVICPE